jgi:hypothetical protein
MKKTLLLFTFIAITAIGCKKETEELTVKASYTATSFEEHACDHASSLASQNSLDPVYINFVNNANRTLTINWINYDGLEVNYFELEDGESVGVPSFLTHPWIIRLADEGCSTIIIPKYGANASETVTFEEE